MYIVDGVTVDGVVQTTGAGVRAFFPFLFILLIWLAMAGVGIFLVVLLIKALLKYLRSNEVIAGSDTEEQEAIKKSLGEALREQRLRCQMTQEFVAERLGGSRQAVSKWENGTSDPSTSNLLALAKLYGVSAEELLRAVEI